MYSTKKAISLIKKPNSLNQIKLLSTRIIGLDKEPKEPIVKTEIPGPNSKKLIDELGKIQV
jgi:hypothetical protein